MNLEMEKLTKEAKEYEGKIKDKETKEPTFGTKRLNIIKLMKRTKANK